MTKIESQIRSMVQFCVPKNVVQGSSEHFGHLFRIVSLVTTLIISTIYITVCAYVGYQIGVYVCLFLITGHLLILYSYKNGLLSNNIITHLFGIMTLVGLGIGTYYSGGTQSPIPFWFISTLIVSFWFTDAKNTRIWVGLIVLLMSLFLFAHTSGIEFPIQMDIEKFSFFKVMMVIGIVLYLSIVFHTFDRWRESVISELNDLNKTKDQMMSMVGHDLKNPLSIMVGHLGLLKAGRPLDEKTIQLFDTLNSRMKQIIDNMLIFERIKNKSYQTFKHEVQISTLMQELQLKFEEQAKSKKIELLFTGDTRFAVTSDPLALERILSNLISNPLKYTPSDKIVSVICSKTEVVIEDQGIGFEKERLKNVFKMYNTHQGKMIHESDESNGIGLFIVKSLCDELGIHLKVESEGENLGTRFTLSFAQES